jgi:hypothetical protein
MMIRRPKLLVLAILVLSLFGCGEEKAAGDKAAADVKSAAKAPKDPAAGKSAAKGKTAKGQGQSADEPAPALSVPEGFKYETLGRRDPFVNPIPKPPPAAPLIPTVRPGGLPGVLLAEAQIKGIVTSRDPGIRTMAIISAPGTPQRITYYAKKGDVLFDAVVKEIRTTEVVFTMISPTTKQPVNRETIVKTGSSGAPAGDKK